MKKSKLLLIIISGACIVALLMYGGYRLMLNNQGTVTLNDGLSEDAALRIGG